MNYGQFCPIALGAEVFAERGYNGGSLRSVAESDAQVRTAVERLLPD